MVKCAVIYGSETLDYGQDATEKIGKNGNENSFACPQDWAGKQ